MSQPFHERRNMDRELNKLDDIVMNNSTPQDTREIALILKGVGENMSDTAAAIGKAVAQMKITEERLSRSMEEVVRQLSEHQNQDNIRIASQMAVDDYRQKINKRNFFVFSLVWGVCSALLLGIAGYSALAYISFEKKIAVIEDQLRDMKEAVEVARVLTKEYREDSTKTLNKIDNATK